MHYKLCHLCHYPVVDGAFQIQSLDISKLSKWWLENLKTKFEYIGIKSKSICKFCVWDARFLHENDEHSNEESAWWPQNQRSLDEYNKYFLTGQMKQCCVKIEKMQPSRHHNNNPCIYKCYFCNYSSNSYPKLSDHIRKMHPHSNFFNCDYIACLHLFFKSEEEKNKHTKVQHSSNSDGQKILRCVYCIKVFVDVRTLSAHVKFCHKNISIRCTSYLCSKYFKSEADRQRHLEEEHKLGEDALKCIYCDKVVYVKRLKQHMLRGHRNIMVQCNYSRCGTYLKCEADRQQHMDEMHQRSENVKKCVYCEKWVRCMKLHVNNFHKSVVIKCNYSYKCSAFFRNDSDRDKHVRVVHLAGKKKQMIDCVYCGKSCQKGSDLGRHMKLFHEGIAIRCSKQLCAQFFKSQADCDKHFKEFHHVRDKLKNIFCPKCSYKTDKRYELKYHLKNMHGNEGLKCSQCPASHRTYRSTEVLNNHVQVSHLLEKKQCPHCNRSMNKYLLMRHLLTEYCSVCKINYLCTSNMLKHKKWCNKKKCEICLKEFNGDIPLMRHVTDDHKIIDVQKLTWLGDLRNLSKKMKCKQCKRCFYNLQALGCHISQTHREKKLLLCDLCKINFKKRFFMEKHMKMVHGVITKAKIK